MPVPSSTTAGVRPARWGPVLVTLSVLAVGLQLWGLYRPAGPPEPVWFVHADKVAHLLAFAAPVLLILLSVTAVRGRAGTAIIVVAAVSGLHAVVSELIQGTFYATRSADAADVLADWLGVALGVAAFVVLRGRIGDVEGAPAGAR